MNSFLSKLKLLSLIILMGGLLLASCSSTQNAVYFSDLDSTKIRKLGSAEFKEPIIQTDDVLNITVQTLGQTVSISTNPDVTAPSSELPTGINVLSGFLVDKQGNVEMPLFGVVKLSGLTTTEAKEIIRDKVAKYYRDPTVQVRFANYKITILGEVAKPATYTVPNEKVSIFDVISMAGDLTIYGKRDNVLLIRDNGGKKEVIRLNLNSSSVLSSPYFYLKQNDVLYVEPTKAKVAVNNAPTRQLITIALAAGTLLVAIIARL